VYRACYFKNVENNNNDGASNISHLLFHCILPFLVQAVSSKIEVGLSVPLDLNQFLELIIFGTNWLKSKISLSMAQLGFLVRRE